MSITDFLLSRRWNNPSAPDAVFAGPGLVSKEECALLYYLTKDYYTGQGSIVDLGCYLGRSTNSLGLGLQHNALVPDKEKRIFSYDRFLAKEQYLEDYIRSNVRYRRDDLRRSDALWFRPIFNDTIKLIEGSVTVIEGEFPPLPYDGGPIEILFVDLAKTEALNSTIVNTMFPFLIPGRSVLIHQDFHHIYSWWIYFCMDFFSDYFKILIDSVRESCVFLLVKGIPKGKIAEFTEVSITERYSYELGLQSMSRMQEQLLPPYRGFIELNKVRWKVQFAADIGFSVDELKRLPLDWINQREHWDLWVDAIGAEMRRRPA